MAKTEEKTEGRHLTIKLPLDFSEGARKQAAILSRVLDGKGEGLADVRQYVVNVVLEHADVGKYVGRKVSQHLLSAGVELFNDADPVEVDASVVLGAGKEGTD